MHLMVLKCVQKFLKGEGVLPLLISLTLQVGDQTLYLAPETKNSVFARVDRIYIKHRLMAICAPSHYTLAVPP